MNHRLQNQPAEDLYLTLPDPPNGLFDSIDQIRILREEADQMEKEIAYDPEDYQRRRVDALRAHISGLEQRLESRLGWNRQDNQT